MSNIQITRNNTTGVVQVNFGDYYKNSGVQGKALPLVDQIKVSFPYTEIKRVQDSGDCVTVRLSNGIRDFRLSHAEDLQKQILEVDSINGTPITSLSQLYTALEGLMNLITGGLL